MTWQKLPGVHFITLNGGVNLSIFKRQKKQLFKSQYIGILSAEIGILNAEIGILNAKIGVSNAKNSL